MDCQRIQDSFLDYQTGTLPPHESASIRQHLKTCLECQREWAGLQQTLIALDQLPVPPPSLRLRTQFHDWLDAAQAAHDAPSPFTLFRSRVDAFFARLLPSRPALQFALTLAVLVAGVVVGSRFIPEREPQVVMQTDPTTLRELADLRAQVESMNRVVSTHLLTQPASQRLQGVIAALNASDTDDRTLARLLNSLAFDPSVNVRLMALEALYAHVDLAPVRAGVLNALPRESSPLVQVAMVDFVIASRDDGAVATLDQLTRNPGTADVVREAARRGLMRLGAS